MGGVEGCIRFSQQSIIPAVVLGVDTHPPGQLIDGPQNGPAPGPWDIAAQPSQLFQDSHKQFEIPHTASVKVCHGCTGAGVNRCWKCLGRGRVSHGISVWGGAG